MKRFWFILLVGLTLTSTSVAHATGDGPLGTQKIGDTEWGLFREGDQCFFVTLTKPGTHPDQAIFQVPGVNDWTASVPDKGVVRWKTNNFPCPPGLEARLNNQLAPILLGPDYLVEFDLGRYWWLLFLVGLSALVGGFALWRRRLAVAPV